MNAATAEPLNDLLIYHLYADEGIEDEILHTFGNVVRVGIDPEPNPYSTVVQADARDPPLEQTADLVVVHHPCGRWSSTTHGTGDTEEWPDDMDTAREVAQQLGDHYILENVPGAPLRDPVVFSGDQFRSPVTFRRAFETSFHVPDPAGKIRTEYVALPSDCGNTHKNWVGSKESWMLAKGYNDPRWPAKGLKRHAVPAHYLRFLLRYWVAARDGDTRSVQTGLDDVTAPGGEQA